MDDFLTLAQCRRVSRADPGSYIAWFSSDGQLHLAPDGGQPIDSLAWSRGACRVFRISRTGDRTSIDPISPGDAAKSIRSLLGTPLLPLAESD